MASTTGILPHQFTKLVIMDLGITAEDIMTIEGGGGPLGIHCAKVHERIREYLMRDHITATLIKEIVEYGTKNHDHKRYPVDMQSLHVLDHATHVVTALIEEILANRQRAVKGIIYDG